MPKTTEDTDNYSLVIYQSPKNMSRAFLQLRKGGKLQEEIGKHGHWKKF